MLNQFWDWLRAKARAAVLEGVRDAMVELDDRRDAESAEAVAALRERLPAAAPPAPHGEPSPADEAAAPTGRRGRR